MLISLNIHQVWDVISGQQLATCNKHDGWVVDCWFSPDRHMLVSASNNIKVKQYTIQRKTFSLSSFLVSRNLICSEVLVGIFEAGQVI